MDVAAPEDNAQEDNLVQEVNGPVDSLVQEVNDPVDSLVQEENGPVDSPREETSVPSSLSNACWPTTRTRTASWTRRKYLNGWHA